MRSFFSLSTATLFLCLVAGSALGQGRNTLPPLPKEPVEIKLEHTSLGKAPAISVKIGEKSYPFLFDSGMGVTMISPDIAKELGCQPFGQISGVNAGGERVDMQRCENASLNVGGFTKTGQVGVFNIMSFFNERTPQIGGAISLHTFEGQILTIDLAKDRLFLESEQSFQARIADMKELESRIARPGTGNVVDLFVAANTPKGKIWMLFDTGNFAPTHVSPAAMEMLGIDLIAPNKAKTVKPIDLDIVGLGSITVPLRERNMIYDGQINYDTIARMVVTIDLRNGRSWAKMNPVEKK